MGTGWRRALCTSISRGDSDATAAERHSPKLAVHSNPSTPRPRPRPRLQCRTNSKSPPSSSSEPCSPVSVSPSTRFALFKSLGLGLSRIRCGICAQSVKSTRQGSTAVFTAECSHAFHFPCIAAHIRAGHGQVCPVCSVAWQRAPLLSSVYRQLEPKQVKPNNPPPPHAAAAAAARVYDDDEPLLRSPTTALFDPIPEVEEEEELLDGHAAALVSSYSSSNRRPSAAGPVEVETMSVAALVSTGRRHQNYVILLKVRAPPLPRTASPALLDPSRRAPIDLVTVLDLGGSMTPEKVQMLKRAVRLLVSSLGPSDRLALVAFSSKAAKRLTPLRRMSPQGQRSTRQIVDRIVACGSHGQGQGSWVGEAIKKATKILQDRRECNPVATIMLLSDGQQQQLQQDEELDLRCHSRDYRQWLPTAAMTRFAHLEIPIQDSGFGGDSLKQRDAVCSVGDDDAFSKCVGALLSVVLHDVHLQLSFPPGEVSAVYSCGRGGGRSLVLGGGGGSCSVRLGDLYAEEERELLVELRVPTSQSHRPFSAQLPMSMSLRCSYRDPGTRQLIRCGEQPLPVPPLHGQHEPQRVEWLRNLFITIRAVAESQRLAELNELATASHLLSSARSLLLQSPSPSNDSLVRRLEAELVKLQMCRHQQQQQQQQQQQSSVSSSSHRRGSEQALLPLGGSDGVGEPLTPTSAWRAAERLAKVAIMRKSLSRVSDLHGFENARF